MAKSHIFGGLRTFPRLLTVLAVSAVASLWTSAQNFAVKTNILGDATLSANIGLEARLAPKATLDLTGQLNAWNVFDGKTWKHWFVMPEARYWLCEAFAGHFFGVDAFAGKYNVGGIGHLPDFLGTHFSDLADRRYQGWMAGAGITYGYAWPVSRHINIEAEIGIGWAFSKYDVYPCATCGTKLESGKSHNYFGPTKAALNFVYIF